ncbi:hypothetical protein evm_007205 [Chilo suppressalis]|nr:hypothetical protein evm_007205 [Chilo suppressalis]
MYGLHILVLHYTYLNIVFNIGYSLQDCPEETTGSGIKVTWPQSPAASNVQSEPLCFFNGTLITRNCINYEWLPNINQLQSCDRAVKYFNSQNCPPGFNKVSENNNKYCYHISQPSVWKYPCFETGGATVITDFTKNEINALIDSLNFSNHKFLWLPAKRQKMFAPVVWHTPGPNWGQTVEVDERISFRPNLLKNCLVLDVGNKILKTEICHVEYESLCFYVNDFNYPAKCPAGYHAFRHMLDDGRCFGIEQSHRNLTFEEFRRRCKKPMGNGGFKNLRKFIFAKIAENHNMPNSSWCWFSSFIENNEHDISSVTVNLHDFTSIENETNSNMMSIINNFGTVGLLHTSDTLSCMACEADIIYRETELFFEYNASKNKIYLTVYFPSGLWKYNDDDRGIQCFSDAKGFFKVIDVYETLPLLSVKTLKSESSSEMYVEKTIFEISLVTDRSASYWCEGHTKNFSLITTEKIVVNPQGREVHVFSLVLEMFVCLDEINNVVQINSIGLTDNLNKILQAEKIIIMDILDYNLNVMQVLLHVHVSINNTYKVEALNLLSTYNNLLQKIELNFPIYNYTFINMSSSVYCLPTISEDSIALYWDLTPVGHIAAPKQFCLQSNGLPVNRHCFGSYLLGSFWGAVIGQCDKSYEPSFTTTLLFNFVQGKLGNEYVSNFLTTGLQKVLGNTDILIPADVYYLSLSFQQVLNIAHRNESSIETGDIQNFAWAIDRIMVVNKNNLRLAQTLNSTNAILDSINDMIAMITRQSFTSKTKTTTKSDNTYQLAIQPRFIVQISYPEITNITGLAVINPDNSDTFDKMKIQPLYKNMTLNKVLKIENLEVATWFPNVVLNNLQKEVNDNQTMHIVINVFSEDVIFQQLKNNSYVINSRIIEIAVPGYSTNSEFGIPLIFRNIRHMSTIKSSKCGFWDFQSETGVAGVWSGSGCALIATENNMSICECYHLTHFGQLININSDRGLEDSVSGAGHKKVLNIITLIGSGLSLIGIMVSGSRGWRAVPANVASFAQRRQLDVSELNEPNTDEYLPRVALHSVYKFGWCRPDAVAKVYLAHTASIHFPTFSSTQGKYVYLLQNKDSIRFRLQCVVLKIMVPTKYLFRRSRLPIYYCQGYAYYVMFNYVHKIEVHEMFLNTNLNMPADFIFEFYHPPTYDNLAKEIWHEPIFE